MEIIIDDEVIDNDNFFVVVEENAKNANNYQIENVLGKNKTPSPSPLHSSSSQENSIVSNNYSDNEVITKRSKKAHHFTFNHLDRQTVYTECAVSKRVVIDLTLIGKANEDLTTTLYRTLSTTIEGKCSVEGFVKPNSCQLISYSSGVVEAGNYVSFVVDFKCFVCNPPEGSNIECVVKNITKAGIRAELNCAPHETSPIVVFVARDHNHYNNELFNSANVGDVIDVHVIGKRFELNDNYVSIIGSMARKRRF